jgi:hypothetical protein
MGAARARLALHGLALLALLCGALLSGSFLDSFTALSFADTRRALGIPNFMNVVSNLPFLLVGAAGLALCAGAPRAPALTSWRLFYAGMALTAFGSGWFHLAPSADSLVCDRLGMIAAFVGLLLAVLQESSGAALGLPLLLAALGAGVASVLWWRHSGDLRVYAFVQLAPLCASAVSLAFGWLPLHLRRALTASLALYVLAKLAETCDEGIYALTAHALSGHSLKHLLAAAAAAVIIAAQWRGAAARARPA